MPRDPQRKILGYRQIIADFTNATTTIQAITGLSVPVIVPTGRKIKVTLNICSSNNTGAPVKTVLGIYDGSVSAANQIQKYDVSYVSNVYFYGSTFSATVTPSATSKTYVAGVTFGAATGTVYATAASGANPAYIQVELV